DAGEPVLTDKKSTRTAGPSRCAKKLDAPNHYFQPAHIAALTIRSSCCAASSAATEGSSAANSLRCSIRTCVEPAPASAGCDIDPAPPTATSSTAVSRD